MLGFRIWASSNTSFSKKVQESWTEGDFWIADALEVLNAVPGAATSVPGALIEGASAKIPGPDDAVNAAFGKLLEGALTAVADIGQKMMVTIEGQHSTFLHCHLFDPDTVGGVPMVRFWLAELKRVGKIYKQDLGDQVMIHICRIVRAFNLHLALSPAHNPPIPALWIYIEF